MAHPSTDELIDLANRRLFSTGEMEVIADAVARATVRELLNSSEFMHSTCRFKTLDPAGHQVDHDNIKVIITFLERVNNIKWGIPRTIVTVVVGAGCIWLLKYYKIFQ